MKKVLFAFILFFSIQSSVSASSFSGALRTIRKATLCAITAIVACTAGTTAQTIKLGDSTVTFNDIRNGVTPTELEAYFTARGLPGSAIEKFKSYTPEQQKNIVVYDLWGATTTSSSAGLSRKERRALEKRQKAFDKKRKKLNESRKKRQARLKQQGKSVEEYSWKREARFLYDWFTGAPAPSTKKKLGTRPGSGAKSKTIEELQQEQQQRRVLATTTPTRRARRARGKSTNREL